MSEHVRVQDETGVRRITLRRPERRNALSQAMYAAVISALEQGDAEAGVRAFLIDAEGPVFTSGNDTSDFGGAPAGGQSPGERFPTVLATTRKPIVVAVNGPAVGVGVTLLVQCDIVLAASSATFRVPFVDLALTAEGASSLLLPAAVGLQRAKALLLLGETWSAGQALAAGLVTAVEADNTLAEAAHAAALRLAGKPPGAVRATKALIGGGEAATLDRIEQARAAFAERLSTAEFDEAIQALMAHRPPDFSAFS